MAQWVDLKAEKSRTERMSVRDHPNWRLFKIWLICRTAPRESKKHGSDAWFLFSNASMSTHWAFRRVIRLEAKVFHFSLMMWKRQAWIVLIKANCTASSQFSSPAVARDSPASTSRKFWRAVALHSGYETFNLGYSAPFWLLLACTLEMVKLFVKRLESKKLVFYYFKAAFLPKMI